MMTTSNEHNNAHAVPQGWKLVPVEPTDAMSIAGGIAWESSTADDVIGPIEDAWAAMLAASPEQNQAQPAQCVPEGRRLFDESMGESLQAEAMALFDKAEHGHVKCPAYFLHELAFTIGRLRAALAATPAPAPAQGEPFGYFRAEPFGWTDCAATDEGAIALYEHPAKPAQEVGLTGYIPLLEEVASSLEDYKNDAPWGSWDRERLERLYAIIAALRAKGGK